MHDSESDSIANTCCKKSKMLGFPLPLFYERHTKSPLPCAPAKILKFFCTMKMFEQTVESQMEGSLGEYETAAERDSRNRRAAADRDVICDVTSLKFRFLGPRMETKTSFVLGGIFRSSDS